MTQDILTAAIMYVVIAFVLTLMAVLLFPATHKKEDGILVYTMLLWGPALAVVMIILLYWGAYALVVSLLEPAKRQAMREERRKQLSEGSRIGQ